MSAFENPARPKHVQFAAPALPIVRRKAENKLIVSVATKPETVHHSAPYLFLTVRKTTKHCLGRIDEVTVSLSKHFEHPKESTDITSTVKPTYKICITNEIFLIIMHTAKCLFNTGSGVSLIRFSIKLLRWTNGIKRQEISQLRTGTLRPLPIEKLILLLPRINKLSTCTWSWIASHLAVEIFLGTSFIDRFIWRNRLLDRRVVF